MSKEDRTSWTDISRERLRGTKVMEKLVAHVCDGEEMSKSQVTAAIALLKKILPDLTAVELSGTIGHRSVVSSEPLTDEQWIEQHAPH